LDPCTYIFTDASFDPKSKRGICAFLVVTESEQTCRTTPIEFESFSQTNCTKLEIESIIMILEKICKGSLPKDSHIFTDCKTVVDLPARRQGLEQKNYVSKGSGKILKNAAIYQKFFALVDQTNPNISWIKGHKSKKDRSEFDEYFAHVDTTARKLLRQTIKKSASQPF